ncbi:tellurite resistance TerB family protein [Oceaniradius stylonematis]|uniref:Tellurite resistance TerB family protein n=1 Tax=Oceaniradius stylonematis TaxID=2184161 RepID=A0A3A8ABX4_9HYPH|nr:tellurite resistance TerB family protein [Oceaniradius stylonematis]RKF07797.1 tellurite resistance TerB family protein [Oceaniradius stylonematis]RNC95843.1 MAG: tellurite resistance TerB family protein [Oricola sp.]
MLDPKKLLNDFLGSRIPGAGGTVRERAGQAGQMAKDNPLATGAIAAVLLGTGVGRELTGSAVKLGAAAAVGGLAYTAWKNYKEGRAVEQAGSAEPEVLPPPQGSEFDIEADSQDGEFPLALVRAMIAAARADGHIDDEERARIIDKLAVSGIDDDEQSFVRAELAKPVDLDSIVGAARTEAQRVELYTASRLAIEPRTRAERGYLDMLAGRLQLPDPLVDHIEATIAGATA